MSGWTQDFRFALRRLRHEPGYAVFVALTLALGIGGITAMFSAFDAVLIRPLPYPDADKLVMIWDRMRDEDIATRQQPAPAEYIEWRRLNTVFVDLAATQPADATLS